jgi:hypothetical protein
MLACFLKNKNLYMFDNPIIPSDDQVLPLQEESRTTLETIPTGEQEQSVIAVPDDANSGNIITEEVIGANSVTMNDPVIFASDDIVAGGVIDDNDPGPINTDDIVVPSAVDVIETDDSGEVNYYDNDTPNMQYNEDDLS